MRAPKKSGGPRRFCVPKQARLLLGAQFKQAGYKVCFYIKKCSTIVNISLNTSEKVLVCAKVTRLVVILEWGGVQFGDVFRALLEICTRELFAKIVSSF